MVPTQMLLFSSAVIESISGIGFSTIFVLLTLQCKDRIWFVIWYTINSVILFINTNYFEYFGKLIHIHGTFILFPELLILIKHLNVPLDPSDIIFVIDLPLVVFLLSKSTYIEGKPRQYSKVLIVTAVTTILAAITLIFVPVKYDRPGMKHTDDFELVSRYGIIGHNIIDMLFFISICLN